MCVCVFLHLLYNRTYLCHTHKVPRMHMDTWYQLNHPNNLTRGFSVRWTNVTTCDH